MKNSSRLNRMGRTATIASIATTSRITPPRILHAIQFALAFGAGCLPLISTDAAALTCDVASNVTITGYEEPDSFSCNIIAPSTLTISSTGTLQNSWYLTNNAGATIQSYGTLNNNGILSNSGTLLNYGGKDLNNNLLLSNYGTLINWSSRLNNNSGATLNNSGSLLNNYGTLTNAAGATLNNSGSISASSSPVMVFAYGSIVNYGTFANNGIVVTNTLDNNGTL